MRSLTPGTSPLVTPRLRAPAAALAVLAAGAVAVLGRHYAGDTTAGHLDRTIAGDVTMRHGAARTLGQALADLGNPLPVAVVLVVLAALAWITRGPRGLALALAGPLTAMVTTSLVLKPIIDRTRGGELAFPSGHTTAVGSMALTAAVLLLGWTPAPRMLRWAGATLLILLVVAVGTSLVGRGIHYPSDTVGAVGVVVTVVALVALIIDTVAERTPRHRAVHPPPRPPTTSPGGTDRCASSDSKNTSSSPTYP